MSCPALPSSILGGSWCCNSRHLYRPRCCVFSAIFLLFSFPWRSFFISFPSSPRLRRYPNDRPFTITALFCYFIFAFSLSLPLSESAVIGCYFRVALDYGPFRFFLVIWRGGYLPKGRCGGSCSCFLLFPRGWEP